MQKLPKAKPYTKRWWVGVWATIWWGVTGLYIILLVWDTQLANSSHTPLLVSLALLVAAGWFIGAVVWVDELKRQKISYKLAFKDLFLTIRK